MASAVPPVLLLHGQPGSRRDWDLVREALGDQVRTVAVDRPGWDGRSPAVGLEGNARAALDTLDAHGIERAVVVGHSFGAAVAAWLAAGAPERVRALVLAAPAANLASLYAADRALALPVIGEVASALTLSVAGGVLVAGPLRRRLASTLHVDDLYLQAAARRLLDPGVWRSFAREQRVLVEDLPRLELRLEAITAPTTIVSGSRDTIVPAAAIRTLAGQIPNARLVVVPQAGHLLPLRHARELAGVVLDDALPA